MDTTRQNLLGYINLLGHFWHAFNNLELFLRLYLFSRSGGDNALALKFLDGRVGEEFEKNSITDYRTFKQLCDAFNDFQSADSRIDFRTVLELRDALAHGRVSSDEQGRMRIIKFTKPTSDKVMVQYAKSMNLQEMEAIVEDLGVLAREITRRMGATMPQE